MDEREACSVQELPLEPELARAPVHPIAGDRQVDRAEVHPDLVRAPGLEPHVEQRMSWQQLNDLEVRHGFARRVGVERMLERVAAIASDRRFDAAATRLRATDDER